MSRDKIRGPKSIADVAAKLRRSGKRIVFTNGCFDLLHLGHVRYLERSKKMGDFLVVGLNSDRSVRRIKGKGRPVQPERNRKEILAALACVDAVVVFDDLTPIRLIRAVRPDVLVKGAHWPRTQIVGADFVESNGGVVRRVRIAGGKLASTTEIIEAIQKQRAFQPRRRKARGGGSKPKKD